MAVAQFRNKTGPEGPQGPKGDKGDDGLSAYQVWLSAGHKGSVDDFFEYIRGPKGKNGKDGKDGKDAKVFAYGRGPSSGGGGEGTSFDPNTILTGPTECLYAGPVAPLEVLIDNFGNVLTS